MKVRSRDLGADFATPALDLNPLVTPRSEPPPLLNVPLAETFRTCRSASSGW